MRISYPFLYILFFSNNISFSIPKKKKKRIHPSYTLCSQGLISGSAELREQAALGLGELIEVTSEQSLKEFVIPITGYLLEKIVYVDYTSKLILSRANF